ncbi:hypothetical protein E4T56_gene14022 [Termitomyces sp. T112]|nr:hypothetical protein E4T56_gene14022 [Termitomyces sp. T112]
MILCGWRKSIEDHPGKASALTLRHEVENRRFGRLFLISSEDQGVSAFVCEEQSYSTKTTHFFCPLNFKVFQ